MNRACIPLMLHEFLAAHYDELLERCKIKVGLRPKGQTIGADLDHGIPLLMVQLVETLRAEQAAPSGSGYAEVPHDLSNAAGVHGADMLRRGFTLDQVVHDYGDLCQAITELAHEEAATITVEEFHTFHRCLDSAIATAVTEFGRLRDKRLAEAGARMQNDRLGLLAAELRTSVNSAMLSFSAIKAGRVAVSGQTGMLLDRSLSRLSDIVERTLAEVRLNYRRPVTRETIELLAFLEEHSVFAVLEATSKSVDFKIFVTSELVVDADRELLSSAIAILLQNALRFTPEGGHVILRATAVGKRVLIGIEDACGGLAPSTATELHRVLDASIADPSRDGSGVSICRHAVNVTGGTLGLEDLPGRGCVFTIDLPKRAIVS